MEVHTLARMVDEHRTRIESTLPERLDWVARGYDHKLAGLTDWPGFDLRSLRPTNARGHAEERAIEVKGRAGSGSIELSENEWAKACNLREHYWLYVVFDCATPHPRLVRVRDPFAKLLVRGRELSAYAVPAKSLYAAAEETERAVESRP